MSARKSKLLITERALRDIADIERYSVDEWGRKVANRYLSDIESALTRIREDSELLRAEDDLHPHLRFYCVSKHLLVFDLQPKMIFLLTVIHASRDIPSRLAEIEPKLAAEVELLRGQIGRKKR